MRYAESLGDIHLAGRTDVLLAFTAHGLVQAIPVAHLPEAKPGTTAPDVAQVIQDPPHMLFREHACSIQY